MYNTNKELNETLDKFYKHFNSRYSDIDSIKIDMSELISKNIKNDADLASFIRLLNQAITFGSRLDDLKTVFNSIEFVFIQFKFFKSIL